MNKDVYVENFMSADEAGGVPIYARVRLDEYLEIGLRSRDQGRHGG